MLGNKISIRSGGIWLFGACLITPILTDVLRKTLPDSRFLLAAVYPLVCFAWVVSLVRGGSRMASSIQFPLLAWIGYQLLYLALALFYDLELGIIAAFTHIAPVGMAWVAYAGTSRQDGLWPTFCVYGAVGGLLLPFAGLASIFGAEHLPLLLQPNADLISLGKDKRVGFSVFAGVFNTQNVLSWTYLACAYLAIAYSSVRNKKRTSSIFAVFILFTSIILVFSSTRRGALYAIIPGIIFWLVNSRSLKAKALFSASIIGALASVAYLDSRSQEKSTEHFEGRLDFLTTTDFADRYNHVFLFELGKAIEENPLGTVLGAASPEAADLPIYANAEVGAAMVAKEIGLVGLVLLLAVVVAMTSGELGQIRRLKKLDRTFCYSLILFQWAFFVLWFFKEMRAVGGPNLAHLLFWSVPGIVAGTARRLASAEQEAGFRRNHPTGNEQPNG